MFQREYRRASTLLEEALALQRELGDMAGASRSLQLLGLVAVTQHDYERATALHGESLTLAQEMEDKMGIVLSLGLGALASLGRRDHERVRELCAEGLELSRQLWLRHVIVFMLHISAALAGAQGEPVRAARLWGASEALREVLGVTLSPVEIYLGLTQRGSLIL